MLQYNPTVSGSLSVTGNISATQGITGSFSGSIAGLPTDTLAFSSSLSTRITNTELTSSEYVSTSGSLSTRVTAAEATSSAFVTASGSLSTRVTDAEATASSYVTASGSLAARIVSNEAKTGSYATTGSNQFNGSQTVTGSLTATGTIVAQTLVVQTITSSIDFVTGSAKFGSTTDNNHQFTGSILISGSVGIGTSPTTKLDVYAATAGSTADILRLKNASNDTSTGLRVKWDFQSVEGAYLDVTTDSSGHKSMTAYLSSANGTPAQVLTIAGSNKAATFAGNVGIGSTPSYTLDVRGDVNGDVVLARLQNRDGNLSTGAYIGFSTGYAAMATIGAKREGAENDSSLVFSPMLNENAVERMRINSGGNVGIGNTSPQTRLDITSVGGSLGSSVTYPTDTNGITVRNSTNSSNTGSGYWFDHGGLQAGIASARATTGDWGTDIRFYTHPTATNNQYVMQERMRILADGYVGIGTLSPAKKLDIYDSNANATAQIKLRNAGSTPAAYLGAFSGNLYLSAGGTYDSGWTTDGSNGVANIVMETSNGGSAIAFGTAASNTAPSERMRIMANGNVGIGTTNPGYRLDVRGGSGAEFRFNSYNSSYNIMMGSGDQINVYSDYSNSAAVMYLNYSSGDVFIARNLHVEKSSAEKVRITAAGEIVQSVTNGIITQQGGSGYSLFRLYGNTSAVELQMGAHQTSGMGSVGTYTSSPLMFKTSNTERMRIMSGGGVGYGQSANGTPLRATLVKRGTTSITFSMSLNTIGAWRPGFATVRVSGAQNGLQEYWAAWFIYRITGYFGAGTSINLLSSGGDTGSVSISSSSDQNSPQAFSITITDSGSTTDTMIADLDVAYHEGIISLT